MKILLDTNILSRLAEPGSKMHQETLAATKALDKQGHTLCIVPQNIYEFWVVCTRPTDQNGLGKTAVEALAELTNIKGLFALLEDKPTILPAWEALMVAYAVLGKNAHDARLVAAMMVHGVVHLLTFNEQDFRRFSEIKVLKPATVAGNSQTTSTE